MNDIMLDIETLGTGPTSVITQIGACYFDRKNGVIINSSQPAFMVNIRIQDCLDKGLTVDGGAIKFWFEQKGEKTFLKNPIDLAQALGHLADFIDKKCLIWSHSTFDIPILSNAYKIIGQGLPFSFRNARDIRSLVDLAGLPYNKPKEDKTHNALDDCIYQVKYCVECFKALDAKKRFYFNQKYIWLGSFTNW